MRAVATAGALLLALTGPAAARAPDLDPGGAEWNGLSRFATGLRGGGLDLRMPERLEPSALPARAGLALIGVSDVGDAPALERFVALGGRLLLAVEGPAADPLLRRLGITRVAAPTEGQRLLGGHPALPVIEVQGGGVLQGVRHLVTNHPAAFGAPEHLEPAARFADGTAFAYHLRVGDGEIVVLADTSVFINLMQDAGDNARFEANLGAWLSGEGARPVYLAAGDVAVAGGPASGDAAAPRAGLGEQLNAALDRLGESVPDAIAVRFIAALLLAATLVFALSVFPGGGETDRRRVVSARGAHPIDRLAGQPGGPAAPPPTPPSAPTSAQESPPA